MVRVDFQTLVTPSLNENQDAEAGRTFDEAPGNECKLRKLVVGVSILPRNPESGWIVAVGLGEIFPSLSEVVGYGSEDPIGSKSAEISRCYGRSIVLCNSRVFIVVHSQRFSFQILPPSLCSTDVSLTGCLRIAIMTTPLPIPLIELSLP